MSDNQIRVVGEYFRNQNGDVIHLAPCARMGNAVRWHWADGKSLHEVAGFVNAADWMRLCARCWPADARTSAVSGTENPR